MTTKHSKPESLLNRLIDEVTLIDKKTVETNAKIQRLRQTLGELKRKKVETENQIHKVRIRHSSLPMATSASPSTKNIGFLTAWAALHEALRGSHASEGLSHNQCVNTMSAAVPTAAATTLRSHLYRLKQRGLIEKVGAYWRLTAAGSGGSHSEESQNNEAPEK